MVLADKAPKEIKDLVKTLVESSTGHLLNFSKLEKLLLSKKYNEISARNLIDKVKLNQMLKKDDEALSKLVNKYTDIKLDVVSLA